MNILTLKVGTKYSSEYVNKLYSSIERESTVPFKMYCYTEDPTGLRDEVIVVPIEDPNEFALQWHKLKFHKTGFAGIPEGEQCLILDIDWIITGSMDEILLHQLEDGQFGCFERWWSNLRYFCKINGGFQMYRMGDTNHLWEKFSADPEYWQSYYVNNGFAVGPVNGEQNFIDQHAGDNRYWFPMRWFAKYHDEEWPKIQKNWHRDVDSSEPYYMGGDFCEDIKMVHFSNSENLIHKVADHHEWVSQYWI